MKKLFLLTTIILFGLQFIKAQPTGYYNGTEGLDGEELKSALHNIIKSHTEFSYTDIWSILKFSDEDPDNSDNLILIYTGRSQNKAYRDRGGNYDYEANGYTYDDSYNREHVWAKSHGNFGTDIGVGTDAHSLKPIDRTVNSSRSYKDFDNGGNQHNEATECYYDEDSWEPRDAAKGDVARIIFYMATRYEGDNGEIDLEVVDLVNTFPNPEHGKLSTLIEWNNQDPPDDFERNRNNVIYTWQKNRNPFIDNPEFANLIWGTSTASDILISNINISPEKPTPADNIIVSAEISSTSGTITASLGWATTYGQVSSTTSMSESSGTFSLEIPAQSAGTNIYYKINASNGTDTISSVIYMFSIDEPFTGTLTSVYVLQGQSNSSPYEDQVISTSGIVTGVFGTNFYLQDGYGAWNGIYVYNSEHSPSVGDSIIITGELSEYYDLTEISNISFYKVVSSGNPLPEPVLISTNVVATGNADAEQYEGVLVKVQNASCTTELGNYGLWGVDDGSGECLIHNPTTFSYEPTMGNAYNITGIATYNYSENKIDIRDDDDIVEAEDIFAPTVTQITVTDGNTIKIDFNEELNTVIAVNISNYTFNHNITTTNSEMVGFTNSSVKLSVSGMTVGDHSLIINGVEDLNGNTMDSVIVDFNSPYTNINELNPDLIKIFPNPINNDVIYINSKEIIRKIEITNISGQMIYNKQYCNKKDIVIHLNNITKGLYFTKIYMQNNKSFISKLMIN